MNIWILVELAFATFLLVMFIGCVLISIQQTMKRVRQSKFEKEMQEEMNKNNRETIKEMNKVAKEQILIAQKKFVQEEMNKIRIFR